MKKIVHVSGKRKRAVARATLKEGKGIIHINHKPLSVYEPKLARLRIQEPLLMLFLMDQLKKPKQAWFQSLT